MIFADLLSLHLVTFLMFSILVDISFQQISNAYRMYMLRMFRSSFTCLWSIVWSESVQLCEPVLSMLLH